MLLRIIIFLLFTSLSLLSYSQSGSTTSSDTITIIIKNITHNRGNIIVKLSDENGYTSPIKETVINHPDSIVYVKFANIPQGYYAVKVWHDKNQNGRKDHFFIGLPSEKFGYSNNVRGRYGAPSFNKTKFYYPGEDTTLVVYLGDYFSNPADNDSLSYKNSLIFAPFSGYAPETSVIAGLSIARLFRFKGAGARSSLVDLFAVYTLRRQTIIEQNYTLFSNYDKWMGQGYSKFQQYPQYYFGVGNNLPLSNKELISYNEIKLEHVLLRKVAKKIFVGAGLRYVSVYNLHQPAGVLNELQPIGYKGSRVSGLIFAFSYDTRDNVYNTFKGGLIKLRYNVHEHVFASEYNFSIFEADLRKFIKPFKGRSSDVLALQLYNLSTSKNTVWNEMGALGSDNIMRGYYNGRYRDNNYIAAQAEYRLYINKMFGLVGFVSFGEVASTISSYNFYGIKPSYGGGVRVRIDNKEKLNLRFDYGIGRNTNNFYVTIAEAF